MQAIIRVKAPVSPDWAIGDLGFDGTLLRTLIGYGRHTQAFAFLSLVRDQLVFAEHCFQGLNRPFFDAHLRQVTQGEGIYVYSYSLTYDVAFDHAADRLRVSEPPTGQVYMVVVSPVSDEDRTRFGIHGWIRWWNWVREDSDLRGAPVNPRTRFARALWTRPKGSG